jgi:cytochrome c-type biogenesis protein CcmH/NrfG
MQFPDGSVILLIIWAIVALILWNLYHYSRALRKKTFFVCLSVITLGLVGGIGFLHYLQQPRLPGNRIGLLILPFIETESATAANHASPAARETKHDTLFADGLHQKINADGMAIAGMIGEHLRQTPDGPFYLIPTDALFEIANHDSLIYPDYVLRLVTRVKLPAIVLGFYSADGAHPPNSKEIWQADFHLFNLRKINPKQLTRLEQAAGQPNLRFKLDDIRALTAELAKAILREWADSDIGPIDSIWQDNISLDRLQSYYTARLALARRETEPALQQAHALFRADSSNGHFVNLHARALMDHLRQKKVSKLEWEDQLRPVIPLLKSAAKRDSLQMESKRLLGQAYIYLERWNDAERALLQAHRLDPTDSKIYVNLAQLHSSRLAPLGFRNELDLYKQALAINPLDAEAAIAAAEYLLLENRENEAIDLLEQYRRLNPNHFDVLMSLGRYYIVKGEAAKIFETYERLLEIEPGNADIYYNLGIAYYNRKDFENAIRLFERAIALDNHLNARMYLSYIYEQQGSFDKAIHYLRERIRLSQGVEDQFADEARRHLYELLLARGEIPPHLQPDSLKKP